MFFSHLRHFFASRQWILIVLPALWLFAPTDFAQEAPSASKDPVQIFNRGQDAHERGDFKTALELYDEAVRLLPEFPEAEFQRGNALLSLNDLTGAETAFRRALALRDNWTLPMTNLGALLVRENKFAEADRFLTKAVQTDESNSSAYAALTELRLKTKAAPPVLKQLLAKIQTLSEKANPNASIWASRAALERVLGDTTSAKRSVDRALTIEPNNKAALTERAEIALAEGDTERAAATAKILLQSSPDSVAFALLQARIYAAQNKPDAALKILDALKNSSSEAALLRDTIAANNSENRVELEKQLTKDEKNSAVLGRLCKVLRTDNPVKALEYCRRAAEAEPNNINHAVGFGAALVQAKQFDNAAAIFRRILQISPDNFTARANLATALFELKRFAEAKIEYRWLTEKHPDLPIAYYFLAISHDNLGEFADALANYQLFLKFADATRSRLEIDKVNLRLPALQNQIKRGGKKEKAKSEKQ